MLENILNKRPIDPARIINSNKITMGHEHFVTIDFSLKDLIQNDSEALGVESFHQVISALNLDDLFQNLPQGPALAVLKEGLNNTELLPNSNFEQEARDYLFRLANSKGKSEALWKINKNGHPFALDDFYSRVSSVFSPMLNGKALSVLSLSKTGLDLINGRSLKVSGIKDNEVYVVPDIADSSVNSGLVLSLSKNGESLLGVNVKNVDLMIFSSGVIFVSFNVEYSVASNSNNQSKEIPSFLQLCEAVKLLSTASNRKKVIEYQFSGEFTQNVTAESLNNHSPNNKLIERQALKSIKLNGLKSCFLDNESNFSIKDKAFNLRQLSISLLGLDIGLLNSGQEVRRSHSYFCTNADDTLSDKDIDYLGFMLSKKYNSDYLPSREFSSFIRKQPLKNKNHYFSPEGGAMIVRFPSAADEIIDSPNFDLSFIRDRAAKTYFPLSLVTLHEYILLTRELHCSFDNLDNEVEINRLYNNALNIRLNFRTLIASQLSQHNEVHDGWREIYKLDDLYDVLSEDLRELYENMQRKQAERNAVVQNNAELEQQRRDKVYNKRELEQSFKFERLGLIVSAFIFFTGFFGMNFNNLIAFDSSPFAKIKFKPDTLLSIDWHLGFLAITIVAVCVFIYQKSRTKNDKIKVLDEEILELENKITRT